MNDVLSLLYGIGFGLIDALLIILIWSIGGIARRNARGCLGKYLTFLIVELPYGVGLPLIVSMLTANNAPNKLGTTATYVVLAISLLYLLSIDATTRIRNFWDNL